MSTMTFLSQPPRLLILIQDRIFQPRLKTCVAAWTHKKGKIALKSTENVAECRINSGGIERG